MREPQRAWLPFAVLALALLGVAGGSIFVRLATAPALAFAAWRLGLAALVVVPIRVLRPPAKAAPRRARRLAVLAGVLLALHFAAWIESLALLPVSASVVLVTTAPVWVVVLGWAVRIRQPSRAELLAIGLSVTGSAVIGWAGFTGGRASLVGALLALSGAAGMGAFLLLSRLCQRELEFGDFLARVYGSAALVLWAAVLMSGTPWHGFDGRTWLAFAGAALFSQLVGHSGYNWALRHLEPVFVAVVLVGEPVLASALAWWLLGERVAASTWAGGVLILLGICVGGVRFRSRPR